MWAELSSLPLPDLSNLTATAVLGWYAWHTVSRTIPGLIEAFRAEIATMRNECRGEREALYQELAAERDQRHLDNATMVDAINELNRMIVDSYHK